MLQVCTRPQCGHEAKRSRHHHITPHLQSCGVKTVDSLASSAEGTQQEAAEGERTGSAESTWSAGNRLGVARRPTSLGTASVTASTRTTCSSCRLQVDCSALHSNGVNTGKEPRRIFFLTSSLAECRELDRAGNTVAATAFTTTAPAVKG